MLGKSLAGANHPNNLLFLYLDLTELELPKTMKTDFPDPADVLNFTLTIEPDEGKLSQLDFLLPL